MERALFDVTARSTGGRLFVALWGGLALVDLVGRAVDSMVAGALVVLLVAACEVRQPLLAAVSIAATGWLVINGFVMHHYGQLGFGAASWWALVLVLAIGVAVALGTAGQEVRR